MTRRPALLVIAHGSRDPRHAATVHSLVAGLRVRRPGLPIETGFLDFGLPSVPAALDSWAARGVDEIVAQPLLLNHAFHAKADIPAVLRRAPKRLRIRQAEVLGPHPLLAGALERRLFEAGLTPADKSSTAVVLAAAGSRDPAAIAVTAAVARAWQRTGWCAVRPAFASAVSPLPEGRGSCGHVSGVAQAVRDLRATGARRVAVAPYVLAPGRLPDRIAHDAAAAGADVVADVLGAAPEVAQVLWQRYDAACATTLGALGA